MKMRRLNLPWRQPEPEPGPITLTSRRLYILPTRQGLVYAALVIGVVMAAGNYGISLDYLFGFLLVGMAMAGLLQSHRNLLGITLRILPVTPVFAGETARFSLRAENPDHRTRGALQLSAGRQRSNEADLPESGQVEFELGLSQPARGFHRPGTLTLASTWPLGLFRCWTVFAFDCGVLVYPKPASEPLPFPPGGATGTAGNTSRAGDDEFHALRSYHPGDPSSRIAWKSLARGLPPATKQFAEPVLHAIHIDWSDAPEQDTEARLSRLTRWVLDAERSGLPWSLRLPGNQLPASRGDPHLKLALEYLARHE